VRADRRKAESRVALPRGAAFLFLAALAAARPGASAGADLATSLTREADRLQKIAGGASEKAGARLGAMIGRVREDVRAGRLHLALHELSQARELSIGIGQRRDGRTDFDTLWREGNAELSRFAEGAKGWNWSARLAWIRALGEDAESQVLPLLQASRPYAAAAGPDSGGYYLSQARNAADFARFCLSLDAPRPVVPLRPASIAGELRRLQDRADAAFQPPRSIDRHSQFIQLNAMLKSAAEMDAAGLYAGALYEYLDAVQELASIEGRPAPKEGGDPAAELARRREALARSERDDSLALFFVERGEAALARSTDPGARAYGAAVLSDVLPAYEKALAASAPAEKPPADVVTVTLVRWPYT